MRAESAPVGRRVSLHECVARPHPGGGLSAIRSFFDSLPMGVFGSSVLLASIAVPTATPTSCRYSLWTLNSPANRMKAVNTRTARTICPARMYQTPPGFPIRSKYPYIGA